MGSACFSNLSGLYIFDKRYGVFDQETLTEISQMSFDKRSVIMSYKFWALALTFLVWSAHAANPGQTAPDFTLTSTDGKPAKLSDHKGKWVVLEWVNPG